MVVMTEAHAQYDDMQGTVMLDAGDFESIQSVLGISEDWHVLGLSVFCHHPSLGLEGKSFADSTRTSLRVWCMADELLRSHGEGLGIPGVISAVRPLPVAEFVYDTPDDEFGTAVDAISIVLRASKRVSLVAWDRSVASAVLGDDDFDIVSEHQMIRDGEGWVESPSEY